MPADESSGPLPLDVAYELLSASRRRHVLYYLLDEAESTTLGDLAEHLAAIENDKPRRAVSASERKRVYIALYQCHLPKLDDADVIDFDSDRGTVDRGANAASLVDYLPREAGDPADARRRRPAIAVVVAGGALLVGLQALYPAGWLSGLVAGGLLTAVAMLAVLGYARS